MTTTPTETSGNAIPSDREKVVALFTELGIGFKPNEHDANSITCTEGDAKIGGYRGFYTNFKFDEAGRFIEMEVWE